MTNLPRKHELQPVAYRKYFKLFFAISIKGSEQRWKLVVCCLVSFKGHQVMDIQDASLILCLWNPVREGCTQPPLPPSVHLLLHSQMSRMKLSPSVICYFSRLSDNLWKTLPVYSTTTAKSTTVQHNWPLEDHEIKWFQHKSLSIQSCTNTLQLCFLQTSFLKILFQ